MTYPEFLAEIDAIGLFRIDMGTGRMAEAAKTLGILDDFPPSIHIAGTNGKGSAASFLDTIFSSAGLATGVTTSPHIFDFRERIRYAGEPIPVEELTRVYAHIRPLCRKLGLTYFEIATLLAFAWFAERKPPVVIAEVGLGGRLDATNILTPPIGMIMPIGYDHTEYLGDTIEKITTEKCGIIKKGMTVISSAQPYPEAMTTIDRHCDERGARHLAFGREYRLEGTTLSYEGIAYSIVPSLPGTHQLLNAATAVVAAIEAAKATGVAIPKSRIEESVKTTGWFGRLTPLDTEGKIILDVGHNALAFREVGRFLASLDGPTLIVIGIMKDKLCDGIFDGLNIPGAKFAVTTIENNVRSAKACEIAPFLPWARKIVLNDSVSEAIAYIDECKASFRHIAIVGSHYLAERVGNKFDP